MTPFLGIMAAFGAFITWGVGDFATQRSIRKAGSLETLFYICIFGTAVLLPFVWNRIPGAFSDGHVLSLLLAAGIVGLVSAVINFEAFKQGKLSVVEPVMSSELVFTALIGVVFVGERLSFVQGALMAVVFFGIVLTMVQRQTIAWWQVWRHRPRIERGVLLAAVGAIAMSGYNVYTGLASIATDPLMAVWYTHLIICIILSTWFISRKKVSAVYRTGIIEWRALLFSASFDNVAWILFATAVLALPISVTIGITESYVVLAMLLGIFINKEQVRRHQLVGGIIAVGAAITLAIISA